MPEPTLIPRAGAGPGGVTAPSRPAPIALADGDEVAAVRARGLRLSAARRLLLAALRVSDGPMSAEQIAAGVGGRVPSSDIASVYRNLETLEAAGIVQHVHLGHGPGLWALVDAVPMEYLTCERCGDYQAVDPTALDPARAAIRAAFGYEASFAHFPVVGLCASCAIATSLAKAAARTGG